LPTRARASTPAQDADTPDQYTALSDSVTKFRVALPIREPIDPIRDEREREREAIRLAFEQAVSDQIEDHPANARHAARAPHGRQRVQASMTERDAEPADGNPMQARAPLLRARLAEVQRVIEQRQLAIEQRELAMEQRASSNAPAAPESGVEKSWAVSSHVRTRRSSSPPADAPMSDARATSGPGTPPKIPPSVIAVALSGLMALAAVIVAVTFIRSDQLRFDEEHSAGAIQTALVDAPPLVAVTPLAPAAPTLASEPTLPSAPVVIYRVLPTAPPASSPVVAMAPKGMTSSAAKTTAVVAPRPMTPPKTDTAPVVSASASAESARARKPASTKSVEELLDELGEEQIRR
jgi:hypothetical protein